MKSTHSNQMTLSISEIEHDRPHRTSQPDLLCMSYPWRLSLYPDSPPGSSFPIHLPLLWGPDLSGPGRSPRSGQQAIQHWGPGRLSGDIMSTRHVFTKEECSRGGLAAARLPGGTCEKCNTSFRSHMKLIGHLGLHGFADRFANGNLDKARLLLGLTGAAATDPFPQNGAFAEGHKILNREIS